MSQQQVCKRAGLAQGYYSRIENDLAGEGPSEDALQKIAEALDFPQEFFFLPDGAVSQPLSLHPMNRKKASTGVKALSKVHAELNLRLIHMRRLIEAVDLEPELEVPRYEVGIDGSPAEIAGNLRQAWAMPDGAIADLTDWCEAAGLIVVHCPLAAGIDGVTMKVRDLPPCVFINNTVTADRMRFSLAHELGHAVLHRFPTDTMEEEANRFASEFLVPANRLRRAARGQKIDLAWLARQKRYWKVSMGAVLYRVGELEILTKHQTRYLWQQMARLGWRVREPEETDFAPENPSVFPRLLEVHSKELGYDSAMMRKMLRIGEADLEALYPSTFDRARGGLRVVK